MADTLDTTNDLLKSLVALQTKQTDTLAKLLTVSRFGPSAAGGSASRSPDKSPAADRLEAFSARQKEIRERGMAYSQIGLPSIGSGMNRAATVAEGAQTLGLGRVAGLAQKAVPVAAAVSAMGAAMDQIGSVARVMNDRFADANTKARQLFRMLPGGETLQRFGDSISGRDDKIAAAKLHGQQAMVEATGLAQQSQLQGAFSPVQAGRVAMAKAFSAQFAAGQGMVGMRGSGFSAMQDSFHPVMDRTSTRGEVAFQNEMRLIPARKELLRTERELSKATAERTGHEAQAAALMKSQQKLAQQRAQVEKELTNPALDSVAAFRKRQDLARILRQQQLYAQQQQGVAQSIVGAKGAEAQAGAARAGAQAGLLRAEASNTQAAADRSFGTARSLGEMDPLSRQQGLNVLNMLKNGANPDLIPAEMKALAKAVAPAEFDKIITQHGAKTETFQRGHAQGLVGFEGNPFELQGQADQMANRADEQGAKAEQQAAKDVAAAGKDMIQQVGKLIQTWVDAAKAEIENMIRMGKTEHG